MNQSQSSLSFPEFLDYCCDHNPARREIGWREFIKLYNGFIYKKVGDCCASWNTLRIKRQRSDIVNDIVIAVYTELCKDESQALRNFRTRDDERRFLKWLAVICSRLTMRHLQEFFKMAIITEESEAIRAYAGGLEDGLREELYEALVAELRASSKTLRGFLERDIYIFQLYIWADFSAPMIRAHPCLKTLGHRVVDNVINRLRKDLRGKKNIKNILH